MFEKNLDPRLKKMSATGSLNMGKFDRKKQFTKDIINLSCPSKPAKVGKNNAFALDIIGETRKSDEESSNSDDGYILSSGSAFEPIQKLSLRGMNLTNLDFLNKFMRENPNIQNIDIGENPLSDGVLRNFHDNLQLNQDIRSINLDGIKNLNKETKHMITGEVEKNSQIHKLITNNRLGTEQDGVRTLNLNNKNISNTGFLMKFFQS